MGKKVGLIFQWVKCTYSYVFFNIFLSNFESSSECKYEDEVQPRKDYNSVEWYKKKLISNIIIRCHFHDH